MNITDLIANLTEFVTWSTLATIGGAIMMVALLTQFTKDIPYVEKIPTQLWSFVLALLVLYPSYFFTGTLTVEAAVLIPFNAVIVSLASNGGYDAVAKLFGKGD